MNEVKMLELLNNAKTEIALQNNGKIPINTEKLLDALTKETLNYYSNIPIVNQCNYSLLGRAVGKERFNFENAIRISQDKIIYYMNHQYGDRYIVPKGKYEMMANDIKVFEIMRSKRVDINAMTYIVESSVIFGLSIDAQVAKYNHTIRPGMVKITKDEYLKFKEYIERNKIV